MEQLLTCQQVQLASTAFLFAGVDDIVVEQLVQDQRCVLQHYSKGQTIFDETHFDRSLGILLSGEILVEKNTADGKRLHMSRLHPGECFGAAAMFHSRNRYASVLTAKKTAEILYLPQEVVVWAMQRNSQITENYIAYLSDRIWFLSGRISALTAGTAQQKVAVYLLEQGKLDISMTDLCQQLNIGRASLYRALEELEQAALIRRSGKTLEIADEEGLRTMTRSDKL